MHTYYYRASRPASEVWHARIAVLRSETGKPVQNFLQYHIPLLNFLRVAEEVRGFVGGEGFAENRVVLHHGSIAKGAEQCHFKDCLFTVLPQQSYVADMAFQQVSSAGYDTACTSEDGTLGL